MKGNRFWPGFRAASTAAVIGCVLAMTAQAQTDERSLTVKPSEKIAALPGSEKRWALIIGIDAYEDPQINRLQAASNDAKELASALISHGGFPRDQVTTLASDGPPRNRPTRGNILRKLSNLQGVVPADGLLVVAFSGHGIERGGRAYLLPTDAQMSENLKLLEETAIEVDVIKKWIRQTGVGQVVMIIDACRNDPVAGRGDGENVLTEAYARGFSFDLRNKEVSAFATLYATDIGHRAYENSDRKLGYFTSALIEGLKGGAANENGEVTLGRLVSYLEEMVPKQISRDLGKDKKQRPFAVIEGYKADELVIALAPLKVASSVATPAADQMKVRAASADPTKLLSSVRTIVISSSTRYLKPSQLENEIRKRPEFKTLGLRIVSDKKFADVEIRLDRTSPISFFYTFSVFNLETGILVTSGKFLKWDGHSAATVMAAEILKQIQASRAPAAPQIKK
ncbi:MAG TPA: caspase family protein [Blastocatellia bacterium]|nr:caspase family protein [Blastocatellia bacterium]